MVKSILKEVIITLLLCIAILLILSILFYDYNPLNKVVPNKVAYSTPENIQNDIEEAKTGTNDTNYEVEVTYSIDSSDLNIYKKSNSYVAGKSNPFGDIEDTNVTDDGQTTNGSTTGTNKTQANTTTQTNTNPDSTGTFLNNTGKK